LYVTWLRTNSADIVLATGVELWSLSNLPTFPLKCSFYPHNNADATHKYTKPNKLQYRNNNKKVILLTKQHASVWSVSYSI